MVQLCKFLAVAAACLAAPAIAHPGEKHDPHHVKREVHARDAMAAHAKRSLGACESTLHARELNKRSIARRSHTVQNLRKKRGITASKHAFDSVYFRIHAYPLQLLRSGAVTLLLWRSGRSLTITALAFWIIAPRLLSL